MDRKLRMNVPVSLELRGNKVKLCHFCYADVNVLKKFQYPDWADVKLQDLVDTWNKVDDQGKYFEMFAIWSSCSMVGSVSLYEKPIPAFVKEAILSKQLQSVAEEKSFSISAGPEIFLPYRRQGYAQEAVALAYQYAREKGYTIAQIQIRTDNVASLALHKKLGFVIIRRDINRKGHEVYELIKLLTKETNSK